MIMIRVCQYLLVQLAVEAPNKLEVVEPPIATEISKPLTLDLEVSVGGDGILVLLSSYGWNLASRICNCI